MLKIIGIGESELETRLMDLIVNQENPTIAPCLSRRGNGKSYSTLYPEKKQKRC